jgi:hypothetical protein
LRALKPRFARKSPNRAGEYRYGSRIRIRTGARLDYRGFLCDLGAHRALHDIIGIIF